MNKTTFVNEDTTAAHKSMQVVEWWQTRWMVGFVLSNLLLKCKEVTPEEVELIVTGCTIKRFNLGTFCNWRYIVLLNNVVVFFLGNCLTLGSLILSSINGADSRDLHWMSSEEKNHWMLSEHLWTPLCRWRLVCLWTSHTLEKDSILSILGWLPPCN